MKIHRILGLLACSLWLGACINLNLPAGFGSSELVERVVSGTAGSKILLLPVAGMISQSERSDRFGLSRRPSLVARVRAQLDRAAEDEDVSAVILRIDSPGGTVTASDILHREVTRFKEETGRPVISHFMGTAASGAYYLAMASDHVLAHPTTVTGSIGVIFSGVSLAGLMEKVGVTDQSITSGPYKDASSPLREMRPEERAQLQSMVDDFYGRFVDIVDAGRPSLARGAVVAAADGRVYSAEQALELGLVDGVGYLQEAVAEAERRAGLSESRVIRYVPESYTAEGLYADAVAAVEPPSFEARALLGSLARPAFLYLWLP